MAFKDTLPTELVKHVTAICGEAGEEWFERLPDTVRELEAEWSVVVGAPFPGIEFNFVAEAERDGQPAVIKIAPPYERTEIYAEAKYLRTRNGQGSVRLLDEDRSRHALLIERALPGDPLFKAFENEPAGVVEAAIRVLNGITRRAPLDLLDVGSLDDWFRSFRRSRESEFPRFFAEKALEIYARLTASPRRACYIHGDFHPGNIVTSDRAEFLAIDPKGLIGHIGYDLAVFMNNLQWWRKNDPDLRELIRYAVERFAVAFELSELEVREWAFAYMVIGAWWAFDEMPEHYDTDLAEIDIWDV